MTGHRLGRRRLPSWYLDADRPQLHALARASPPVPPAAAPVPPGRLPDHTGRRHTQRTGTGARRCATDLARQGRAHHRRGPRHRRGAAREAVARGGAGRPGRAWSPSGCEHARAPTCGARHWARVRRHRPGVAGRGRRRHGRRLGGIDVVVANAGIANTGTVARTRPTRWPGPSRSTSRRDPHGQRDPAAGHRRPRPLPARLVGRRVHGAARHGGLLRVEGRRGALRQRAAPRARRTAASPSARHIRSGSTPTWSATSATTWRRSAPR